MNKVSACVESKRCNKCELGIPVQDLEQRPQHEDDDESDEIEEDVDQWQPPQGSCSLRDG